MAATFIPYEGDGATNAWTVPFDYLSRDHVKLYVDGVEDTTFTWITSSSIAATSTPGAGAIVLVKRVTPRDALSVTIPNAGTLRGQDINAQSLQALYVAQEGYDALTSVMSVDTTTGLWDAAGIRMQDLADPQDAQDAATKNYVDVQFDSDLATIAAAQSAAAASASSASSSASSAASSASAASGSATSASGSASAAAASASAASTSASNAATSATAAQNAKTAAEAAQTGAETAETNASSSASAASSSASAASSSASAASTSASNAATSASAASTSASNAATSEANAAASYDAFDDRYLGAKASDPALDNDGNALLTGAMYWNTSSSVMKVYNGSAWEVFVSPASVFTGYMEIPIAAMGMVSRTTNGAAPYVIEKATNDVMVAGYAFDDTVEEFIDTVILMPQAYDGGAIKVKPLWTTATTAGTGTVVWVGAAKFGRDSDAIDSAYGSDATVADAFQTDSDDHIGGWMTITPGGTYDRASGARTALRLTISRDPTNGSDDYTEDAVLVGLLVAIPTDTLPVNVTFS